MSRYVQRCRGECGKVRGVSAFSVQRCGGRAPVCRFCTSNVKSAKATERGEIRLRLTRLAARESALRQQLATVARERLQLSLALTPDVS